ncbi:restriction endonuclease [Helicobacter heilmannii]|uniref:restriction endonuclease n=1 Tax=Helicobacter heilmannii TaxID=35817 RepID=UPI0018F85773|nr:restriction endonuclease [Helicobacter heilmannii]GMB95164.1 Non-functional type II restriction endonuclease [Helicobacter heilmannii]
MLENTDFKQYRESLGFKSQQNFKAFLSAKDIKPQVDFSYIDALNARLCEIFNRLNGIYYKPRNIEVFLQDSLFRVYEIMRKQGILEKLTNQGRRKEEVYFSWMRGYLICAFFKEALATIFDVRLDKIQNIGADDFSNLEVFKRTPKADLQIGTTRLEIQSGFQGVNDIKAHKVWEAKRVFEKEGQETLAMHIDLFNGQVALVNLSKIEDNHVNWIIRAQMEGQMVFNIDPNDFKWLLLTPPPKLSAMLP